MKQYYITTPIYYANDKPHIGHAYTTIGADIMRRWHTLCGHRSFLLTGTDEHGSKVARAAREAGREPQEFLNEMVVSFKKLWPALEIQIDDFIRTTDTRHRQGVQAFFSMLHDNGDIYKGHYTGPYCVPCETFFTEQQITDGKCPDCGRPVELLKEESYFFRLSKYQDFLLDWYRMHPEFLQPKERAPEIIRFVESGLRDLSVSRTRVSWGIPVPFDKGHTVYVWFDALLNYITAAGYGTDQDRWKLLWPADVHFVGKEIFKFHAVMWPAMLRSAGLAIPKTVFAHGWWTVEGQKMSKSLGNVIDPVAVSKTYSVDAFRYFLFREIPFGGDGNFSHEAFNRRYNAELANDLGNLFSRTLAMTEKYCDGMIPPRGQLDGAFADEIARLVSVVADYFSAVDIYQALIHTWKIVEKANQYIELKAPWKKTHADAYRSHVLYSLIWVLDILSVLVYPVMPHTAECMNDRLGAQKSVPEKAISLLRTPQDHAPQRGKRIHKGNALFPRIN
ncbi:MAG: methionine--tRNA ligase [Elusimicrobia bacterium]|nr:methionine--tRNA ligase [Elusimicrobiota bacterium]MBD3412001.1 methionine--tRNA ligase [Elusimicrobiota bacterium]